MIQHVNFSTFVDSFSDTYKNNFSYEGKRALFDYLESMEEDTGDQIELDTGCLCCDYTEYENFAELQKDYPDIKDFEDLNNNTLVIPIDNAMKTDNFIIQQF